MDELSVRVTVGGVEYEATIGAERRPAPRSNDGAPLVRIYRAGVLVGSGWWAGRIAECPTDLGDDVYDALDAAIAEAAPGWTSPIEIPAAQLDHIREAASARPPSSYLEQAALTDETCARDLAVRAMRRRDAGQEDWAREYEGLAAEHAGNAAELRRLDEDTEKRIAAIRAM